MERSAAKGSYGFSRELRLRGKNAFTQVHQGKLRRESGVLLVYAISNGLSFSRIGMAVNRRVGNAIRRNQIKRRIREAFRLHRHEWPKGYDWMVVVRPHEPQSAESYANTLSEITRQLDDACQRKQEIDRA